MRLSEQIQSEIVERLGFVPPFFEPALNNPQILENLWQQTVSAYLDNPLPALFKEKLNAYLSRFCTVPYCMVCHSSTLRPLGMKASDVLALLETPPPTVTNIQGHLLVVSSHSDVQQILPEPASDAEESVIACATTIFLEDEYSEQCRIELHRLLGSELYDALSIYMAYIKVCHTWIQTHPIVSYESDQRAIENLGPLIAEEPSLDIFFRTYRSRVDSENEARRTRDTVLRTLHESEERFRLLMEGARDYAMLMMDTEGKIVYINPGAERILGYTEQQLHGSFISVIFTPEDREYGVPDSELSKAVVFGRAEDKRWHQRHDGSRFWADGVLTSLMDDQDQLRGFAKVMRDATAQKQVEDSLRASEQRFRQMADAIPHIAWTALPDGSIDYYNQRWFAFTGFTFEETRAWGWDKVIHKDDLEQLNQIWKEAIETGADYVADYRLRNTEGRYIWHQGRAEPVRDDNGSIVKWVGTITDISDRKMIEASQAEILEHEHRIATHLQRALQPELPSETPGISISKYYEAALEEAEVGGDFYDVYAVEEGCTALVVGDLSGKGLEAAAQVSTVRNMLRATLYLRRFASDAIEALNHIIVENKLLSGFATLFVGMYDQNENTFTYVNCGQDPALVKRASDGSIERLLPTGTILGAFDGIEL